MQCVASCSWRLQAGAAFAVCAAASNPFAPSLPLLLPPPRRQVTALNPAHFRAHKLLGSALYALGDFEAAATALKQALK